MHHVLLETAAASIGRFRADCQGIVLEHTPGAGSFCTVRFIRGDQKGVLHRWPPYHFTCITPSMFVVGASSTASRKLALFVSAVRSSGINVTETNATKRLSRTRSRTPFTNVG